MERNLEEEEREDFLNRVFFAVVDREEALEGVIWEKPLSQEELERRFLDFQVYLNRCALTETESCDLLDSYEGYLMLKCAFTAFRNKVRRKKEDGSEPDHNRASALEGQSSTGAIFPRGGTDRCTRS